MGQAFLHPTYWRTIKDLRNIKFLKRNQIIDICYETQCYWFPNMARTDIWYLHFAVTEQNMTIMCYTYKVPFIHGAPILPILVHWFSQKTWKAEGSLCYPHFIAGDIEIQKTNKLLVHYRERIQLQDKNYTFIFPLTVQLIHLPFPWELIFPMQVSPWSQHIGYILSWANQCWM